MDLIKDFWDNAVSRKQCVNRGFINDTNNSGISTFEKIMPKLCMIEMTDPVSGMKKFAHNEFLDYSVYYDGSVYYDNNDHNYYILKRICQEMFIKKFGIKVEYDCVYGESGKEIEKFFTENFSILEKFLDNVLVPSDFMTDYSVKDSCEFYIPGAFLYKKSMWIGSLMKHNFKYDYDKYELLDEIEEKSYDEDGHFEYYNDMCDDAPTVLEDWINAFFLIVASYYSIRKVKFCDVYPDFNEKDYMNGYIQMSGKFDISVLDELIDRHIKTYDDINHMLDDYDRYLYGLGYNDISDNGIPDDVSEIIEKIKENKPDGAEFKLMMKYQDETIKMWIVKCLVRTFED